MAVIVAETTGRESSGDKSSLQAGSQQTLTDRKVRTFRVSGVANDTVATNTSGIPQIDDVHPQDSRLLCIRVNATSVTPTIFDVRCEYEFIGPASSNGNGLPDPTVSWSSQLIEEPTQFDVNNKQIVTKAGEAYDGTVTRNYPIAVLQYEFSSFTFPGYLIFSHVGRVNSGDWTTQTVNVTVPPLCALLRGLSAKHVITTDSSYYRVTYDIAFRSQMKPGSSEQYGWNLMMLNAGFMYKNSSGKLVNITDSTGVVPRGGPWLLSTDGTDHSVKTPSITPNYIGYALYQEANFGALGVI